MTVYDEDSNNKNTFLGKILSPLVNMKNGQTWYSLKDKTLINKAKGRNPKILLEVDIQWNLLRASVQAIKLPKIKKKEPDESLGFRKLCLAIKQNVIRVKAVIPVLDDRIIEEIQKVLRWKF